MDEITHRYFVARPINLDAHLLMDCAEPDGVLVINTVNQFKFYEVTSEEHKSLHEMARGLKEETEDDDRD